MIENCYSPQNLKVISVWYFNVTATFKLLSEDNIIIVEFCFISG